MWLQCGDITCQKPYSVLIKLHYSTFLRQIEFWQLKQKQTKEDKNGMITCVLQCRGE